MKNRLLITPTLGSRERERERESKRLPRFIKLFFSFFFVVTFFFAVHTSIYAATYNIGPGQTYTTFTALAAAVTLQPDDIVDGGANTFNETWTVNGSGTSGHPITIRNATIDSQLVRGLGLSTNSKNYLALSNLTITNSNVNNIRILGSSYITIDHYTSSGKGSAISTFTSSHITISNLTSTNNDGGFAALDFDVSCTDLSISSTTISNSVDRGIYSLCTSNVTLDDVEATGNGFGDGIEIKNMTSGNLTLTNIYTGVTRDGIVSGNTGYGLYLFNDDNVLLNADGIYSKNNTGQGVLFNGSALTTGSILKNFNVSSNLSNGISVTSTPNLTLKSGVSNYNTLLGINADGAATSNLVIENVTMNYNKLDGFNEVNGVLGVIVRYSEASYNGTVGNGISAGAGDGFSIHDTCTGTFYYDKAIGNLNTGFAQVQTSAGSIYNSLIVNNGSPSDPTMNRAGLYLTTTANPGFTVENNIVSGNYPADIMESSTSHNNFDYNLYNPLDNNKFYTLNDVSFTSWADYHVTREAHSLNSNPLFVNASSNDFHLTSSSPAINAGISVGLTQDYDGNAITDGFPDIGAYEFFPSVSSSTSSSSSSSSSTGSSCSDSQPTSAPNLFQIDVTGTSAKLFFAPAKDPVNKYFIAYSLNKNVLMYGVEYSQGYSGGVLSYTINFLNPNSTYYFKVKGGNGCMAGDWSGTLGVKTTSSKLTKKSFYLWSCLNGRINPLACIK